MSHGSGRVAKMNACNIRETREIPDNVFSRLYGRIAVSVRRKEAEAEGGGGGRKGGYGGR